MNRLAHSMSRLVRIPRDLDQEPELSGDRQPWAAPRASKARHRDTMPNLRFMTAVSFISIQEKLPELTELQRAAIAAARYRLKQESPA